MGFKNETRYRGYLICKATWPYHSPGLKDGFTFAHDDWEPGDTRHGEAETMKEAKSEIDELVLSEMLAAYIDCALWSSVNFDDEKEKHTFDSLGYDSEDVAEKTRLEMEEDCRALLEEYPELDEDPGQAGHDFWLTRNRHGAGFWDGSWKNGDELTEAAHAYGSVYLYRGDDDKIHS